MKKRLLIPVNLFIFIFLMIFISAGAAPGKNSAKSKKSSRSDHKYSKMECKGPSMKEYKKLTGYNKQLNKSRRAG